MVAHDEGGKLPMRANMSAVMGKEHEGKRKRMMKRKA